MFGGRGPRTGGPWGFVRSMWGRQVHVERITLPTRQKQLNMVKDGSTCHMRTSATPFFMDLLETMFDVKTDLDWVDRMQGNSRHLWKVARLIQSVENRNT